MFTSFVLEQVVALCFVSISGSQAGVRESINKIINSKNNNINEKNNSTIEPDIGRLALQNINHHTDSFMVSLKKNSQWNHIGPDSDALRTADQYFTCVPPAL